MQRYCKGLNECAVSDGRAGRQLQALPCGGNGIFGITSALQAHLVAPRGFATQAAGALAATPQRRNGDRIAELESARFSPQLNDLAGEFVSQNRTGGNPERRLLRHV
jgi:hypothetical protein